METVSPLISHSMSTIIDKRVAVRVTNTAESADVIKQNTQIVEFSVVTRDKPKYIKPVDMASLSMIPGDSDLTAYPNKLLRTKTPEKQNNTFCVATPENPGKTEDHTPIQTRILRNYSNSRRKKNSIHRIAKNPKTKPLNDLIGPTHF